MTRLEILGLASMVFTAAFTARAVRTAGARGQSPIESIIEAWVNIAFGFSINYVANLFILPLLGDKPHVGLAENWWMGWCFTAISMVRQYALRRFFNDHFHRLAARVARHIKETA